MHSDDIAISVQSVSKNFKLPHERAGSIKSIVTGFYNKNANTNLETQNALKEEMYGFLTSAHLS